MLDKFLRDKKSTHDLAINPLALPPSQLLLSVTTESAVGMKPYWGVGIHIVRLKHRAPVCSRPTIPRDARAVSARPARAHCVSKPKGYCVGEPKGYCVGEPKGYCVGEPKGYCVGEPKG